MFSESYNSLLDFIREFPNDEACHKHLAHIRWGDDEGAIRPVCPHCEHDEKIYSIESGKRYKCSACRKKFSLTVGTVFENTKIPLQKWFLAIWLASNHKKGISSCQLAKDIGIQQKHAWHMLHRIREMFKEADAELLEGEVEADETFIGGKEGWKHIDKRDSSNRGRSTETKTPVFGLVERGGDTRFFVVENTKAVTLQDCILPNVKPHSTINTDEWLGYRGLGELYQHEVICHGDKEYVRGNVHSNTIENRWSHFRRTITGTYHHISRKHMQRYADESAFRLNTRDDKEGDRFDATLAGCEGRLTYRELILPG